MHIHNDGSCQHDLKVCVDCGNVYCTKCFKTWFKEQWQYVYSGSYTGTEPYKITYDIPTTVTYHAHTS